ncbi:GTPase-associated system all-helical protein GASH [Pedobacter sp. L105]|uniref:GTPase-associated system all-helical protein GASH n=1 Tax=Pedobacter sp. L105 TaxID=1641871 RepID=UPI00131ADFD7|nr:GTPase-associated system all-helical protein GASH [Pedobacter sp. L105]
MLLNLPKWYRIATVESIGEDAFEKRSLAIETIVTTKDLQFLLDCIRLYLDKPIKNREFNKELFLAISSSDGMFIEDNGSLENRVIAGAIISEAISKNTINSLKIATALKLGIFGVEKNSILNIDIVQSAIDYLNQRAESVREPSNYTPAILKYQILGEDPQSLETLTAHIRSQAVYLKSMATNIEKQRHEYSTRLKTLEEESNIHWWLFREFSKIKNVAVAELIPEQAPFVLALELGKLFISLPQPNNAESFLNKILSKITNLPSEFSIKNAIDIVFKNLTSVVEEKSTDIYGNLSPLYFAYSKAIESGGNEAWTAIFIKQTSISSEYKCSALEMSLQFLNETLLYEF